ncbi:Creatinine amidohydrolase [subsurface metagenome]
MKTIKFEDMSWSEVAEVLKEPNAMILPVGSIEQHGPHLPLNVDFRITEHIAWQAARRVTDENKIHVLVAPAVRYAEVLSGSSRTFPGTTGVRFDTFMSVIGDIIWSFVNQGFKNIIVLNGHLPNRDPIAAALRRIGSDLRTASIPNIGLYAINWWEMGSDVISHVRKSEAGLHADEIETSICLVIQPENVHLDKALKWFPSYSLSRRWVGSCDLVRDVVPSVFYHSRAKMPKGPGDPVEAQGIMGDPTVATKETGEKIVSAVVDDLTKVIVEIVESEGK